MVFGINNNVKTHNIMIFSPAGPLIVGGDHDNDRDIVVQSINRCLAKSWTIKEISGGRKIEIPGFWRSYIDDLILEYRNAGWLVSKQIEISSSMPKHRSFFMTFKNPNLT